MDSPKATMSALDTETVQYGAKQHDEQMPQLMALQNELQQRDQYIEQLESELNSRDELIEETQVELKTLRSKSATTKLKAEIKELNQTLGQMTAV